MDLVSVIVTARNRPAMLREAVESVLAQTYDPLEIIIVLTGATDDTISVAKEFAHSGSATVRLVEIPPRNLSASRNAGIAAANGEWVTFLDDDDLYDANKIQLQIDAATKTGADVVTNSWIRFNEHGPITEWTPRADKHLPAGLSYAEALMTGNFVSNGLLVRTHIMRNLRCFDEGLSSCEDWDMWRRISHHHDIVYIDAPLVRIRVHGSNMSSRRWHMTRNAMRHLAKIHIDTPARLRYMLPRSRSEILHQFLPWAFPMKYAYAVSPIINRLSHNRLHLVMQRIRSRLAKSA